MIAIMLSQQSKNLIKILPSSGINQVIVMKKITSNSVNVKNLHLGQRILHKQMHKKFPSKAAKNLIIVIADGMSIATQTATRVYLGNEEINLSFEEFPYAGLSKTYCVNYQVSDSACTATALLSGIKTNFGVLSMNANVPLNNCSAEMDNGVDSIFKYAQRAGKSTAIVTNTKITDATVAGK